LSRAIVVHGHFYQPPRENPWLESVEVQDSAAPFHDWNERVSAESYAPNTAARRVDDQNRVLDIVNNFEKISFNIGPTLFAWLERHRPDVYRRVLSADQAGLTRTGHGSAVAQGYGHTILPLDAPRRGVRRIALGGHPLVPVMERRRRVLDLHRVEPRVLARWLVEMPVDDDRAVQNSSRPRRNSRRPPRGTTTMPELSTWYWRRSAAGSWPISALAGMML